MHAALHNVAATIVVVGIAGCVVRIIIVVVVIVGSKVSTDEKVSSMMEAVVAETVARKAVARKATARNARNSCGADRRRAREAVADTSALERASADPSGPSAGKATSETAASAAASSTAPTAVAAAARCGQIRRQHAD